MFIEVADKITNEPIGMLNVSGIAAIRPDGSPYAGMLPRAELMTVQGETAYSSLPYSRLRDAMAVGRVSLD